MKSIGKLVVKVVKENGMAPIWCINIVLTKCTLSGTDGMI